MPVEEPKTPYRSPIGGYSSEEIYVSSGAGDFASSNPRSDWDAVSASSSSDCLEDQSSSGIWGFISILEFEEKGDRHPGKKPNRPF